MKWVISSIVYLYIVSRANSKSLKKPKHITHNCTPDENSIQTTYLRKMYDSITKENHEYDETNDSYFDYSNVNNHNTFSTNRRMNNDYNLGINYDTDSIKSILKRQPMKHTLNRRLDDENTEKNSNKALDAVLNIRELREQLLKHLVHYIKNVVNEISKTSKRTINIGKTLSSYYENNKHEKNNANDVKTTIEYDDEDISEEHETVTEIIATTELETEMLSKQEETGFNESQVDINDPVTDQETSVTEGNPTTSTYPNDNEPASTQSEETQNIDAPVNDNDDHNASDSLKTVEREENFAESSSTSEIEQENFTESSSTSEIEQENLSESSSTSEIEQENFTESPSRTAIRQDILPESPATSESSTLYTETIGTTTVATETIKATIIASNYDNENKIISNELPDESTNRKNEENKEKQDIKAEISYGKSIAFNEDQNINDNIQDVNDKIQNITDTIQDVNDNKDKIEDINDTNDKIKDFNDKAVDTVTSKDEFKEENTANTLNYSEIEKYIMNPFKAIASNPNRREGSKNTFLHLFLHLVMQK